MAALVGNCYCLLTLLRWGIVAAYAAGLCCCCLLEAIVQLLAANDLAVDFIAEGKVCSHIHDRPLLLCY